MWLSRKCGKERIIRKNKWAWNTLWLQPTSVCLSRERNSVRLQPVKLFFIPLISAVILSTYKWKLATVRHSDRVVAGWGTQKPQSEARLLMGFYDSQGKRRFGLVFQIYLFHMYEHFA